MMKNQKYIILAFVAAIPVWFLVQSSLDRYEVNSKFDRTYPQYAKVNDQIFAHKLPWDREGRVLLPAPLPELPLGTNVMVVFDSHGLAGTFFPTRKFGSDLVGGYMYLQERAVGIANQDGIELGGANQQSVVPVRVVRRLRPNWYYVEPIITE